MQSNEVIDGCTGNSGFIAGHRSNQAADVGYLGPLLLQSLFHLVPSLLLALSHLVPFLFLSLVFLHFSSFFIETLGPRA